MKVRDVIKLIEKDGWRLKNQEGSHRQFVHPAKTGKVTISSAPGDDVAEGMLRSILKQAGLTKQLLLKWKKKK